MPTEKKKESVAQLVERLSRSRMVVLTDYRGINMKDLTALRRALEKADGGYHVVKNTLLRLALRQLSLAGLEPYLEGPTAVAFGYGDAVALAKALREQLPNYPALRVKAAWMPGQVLPPEALEALATLPPRPVLLGQVVGALQSPLAGLVGALSGVLRQLVYVLSVRAEQGERPAEAA
ncbi:MAG: 50S ribosomal protein L10 [Chloroflexia bacterium]